MIVVSIFRIFLDRVIQKFTDCQKESPDYVFKILKLLNNIKNKLQLKIKIFNYRTENL